MKRRIVPFVAAVVVSVTPALFAQNARSAVSIAGVDTNPCTVASPCRSFAAAMSHTNPGGEIIALTSGGFGSFTVDRSVTVQAAPGVYAGVTATFGDGITVNAGSGAKVILRNLFVNGGSFGGAAGISVPASGEETNIENCVISGFNLAGVNASFNVHVSDTTIRNCAYGVFVDRPDGPVTAVIERAQIAAIHYGGSELLGIGILAQRNATVTVRDTLVSDADLGMQAWDGPLLVENSFVTGCPIGIQSRGVASMVRLSNTVVTAGGKGISCGSSMATVETWDNNKVRGNSLFDLSPTCTWTHLSQN